MRMVACLLLAFVFGCQSAPTETVVVPEESDTVVAPAKKYSVGTRYFTLEDRQRRDPYYDDIRVLNLQMWYPTDSLTEGTLYKEANYYSNIAEVWEEVGGWNKEDIAFVDSIGTNSLINAPFKQARGKYPVLLFSPSLGGHISTYTYFAEKLANAGYVVIGVNHLHEHEYVVNNKGDLLPANYTYHDSIEGLSIPDQISADEFRALKSTRAQVLADDIKYLLDLFPNMNLSTFEGRLDLNRVGIWGHSIGGASATLVGIQDDRVKAVLNMDGTPPSEGQKNGINIPFMFLEDLTDYENHEGYKKQYDRRNDFCQKGSGDAYRILFAGINHQSFSDLSLHFASSDSSHQAAQAHLNAFASYVEQFFDAYLNGEKPNITAVKSDSLEVVVFEK